MSIADDILKELGEIEPVQSAPPPINQPIQQPQQAPQGGGIAESILASLGGDGGLLQPQQPQAALPLEKPQALGLQHQQTRQREFAQPVAPIPQPAPAISFDQFQRLPRPQRARLGTIPTGIPSFDKLSDEEKEDLGSIEGLVTVPEETLQPIIPGGVSAAAMGASAVEWLSGSKVAGEWSKAMKKFARESAPRHQTIVTDVFGSVGSSLTFFVPGVAVVAATTAGSLSVGAATILGVGVSTFLESAVEAGGVFDEMKQQGKSVKDAGKAATKAFWANVMLIGSTEFFGPFSPSKSLLKTAAKNAITNIPQEMGQDVITAVATGKTEELTLKSLGRTALVAGLSGPITGLAGQALPSHDVLIDSGQIEGSTQTIPAPDIPGLEQAQEAPVAPEILPPQQITPEEQAIVPEGEPFTPEVALSEEPTTGPFAAEGVAPQELLEEARGDVTVSGEPETPSQFETLAEAIPKSKVKTTLRQLTGQVKAGNFLVDDRTALNEVLRAQQKVSKKALAVGKKLGISTEKERAARLNEARAHRDEIKKRVAKAAKVIKTQPLSSLPLEYKKRIDNIIGNIDPFFRSKKTLAKRSDLKAFVQQQEALGETINIPQEKLDILDRKSLSEYTVDELESLATTVKQLTHVGKLKGRLLAINNQRSFENTIGDLTGELDNTVASRKGIIQDKTLKGTFSAPVVGNLRLEPILNLLDNTENTGVNSTTIWDPINAATNQYKRGMKQKEAILSNGAERNNIDLAQFAQKKRSINQKIDANNEGGLTGNELVSHYLAIKDSDQLRILTSKKGDGLTRQDLNDILTAMSPEEKALADHILENYWGPQFDEVNPVNEQLTGETLPRNPNYSEIVYELDISDERNLDPTKEFANELWGRKKIQSSIKKDFTQERTGVVKGPLNHDFLGKLMRNIDKVEHFKAFALPGRDIKKIMADQRYRKAIVRTGSEATLRRIDKHIEQVITRKSYAKTPAGMMGAMFRRHATPAMLGANVVTSLKQPASLLTASALIGPTAVLSGMYQVATDHKGVQEFIFSKSPQQEARSIERDWREMLEDAKRKGFFTRKEKWNNKALSFLQWFDNKTVLSVWKGAYDQQMAQHGNDAVAVKEADRIVRRTQPAFEIKDLPAFFKGGEFEKMLNMFMNQRNQNWNLFIVDVVGKVQAGKITKAEGLKQLWWMWLAPGVILGALSRGGFDSEPETIAMDIATNSPLAGTFLVGNLFNAILTGWDWNIPAFQFAVEGGRALRSKTTRGRVKHGAKAVGLAAGIGGTAQIVRSAEGAIDLANRTTDDLRRLVWGKGALRKYNQNKITFKQPSRSSIRKFRKVRR